MVSSTISDIANAAVSVLMLSLSLIFFVIAFLANSLDKFILPPANLSASILPITKSASVIVGFTPPFE